MIPIPLTAETADLARRLIWFEEPSQALADPLRLAAYAFAHGTYEDIKTLRQHWTDDDFRTALDKAPPGIIDARSWAYWNAKFGRIPAPPLPERRLPE